MDEHEVDESGRGFSASGRGNARNLAAGRFEESPGGRPGIRRRPDGAGGRRGETLLIARLGAPREGDRWPNRTYAAVCEHGETFLTLRAETDAIALSQMLLHLHDHPLTCEEASLASAARAFRIACAVPGPLQELELANRSAADDLDMVTCRVPPRVFTEYLLSSVKLAAIEAWKDPRLARRFFLATMRTSRGRTAQFTLVMRNERTVSCDSAPGPSIALLDPAKTDPGTIAKFTSRFAVATAWTRERMRRAFDVERHGIPGRGRQGRGVSPTELRLLTAAQDALADWLIQRAPVAEAGGVAVKLEEHPLSRLANVPAAERPC